MPPKRFVTLDDLTWLASRSFISKANVTPIWESLKDSTATYLVHEDDFDWLANYNTAAQTFTWKDAVTTARKAMRERCSNRAVVSESDIELLQHKKLLRSNTKDEVTVIWKELCDRCVLVDEAKYATNSSTTSPSFTFHEKSPNFTPTNDICIAFAPNGFDTAKYEVLIRKYLTARLIQQELIKSKIQSTLFRDDQQFKPDEIEQRISSSFCMIAILTDRSLETKEMLFALQAASFHYKELSRIILVHVAESCFFPVPPPSVSACFSEKAITWLSCYAKEGIDQIVHKYKEEKTSWENSQAKEEENDTHAEDLTTRVFLSHKRSTGQGIAGRLYEGLKDHYKVFLDSEAKFKIHNLKEIVKHTEVFVFLLTHGILLSHWCLQELLSALENEKKAKVIVIRDLAYSLPAVLPAEWQCVEHLLRSPDQLLWMAEYNSACIHALRLRIGAADIYAKDPAQELKDNPSFQIVPGSLKLDSETFYGRALVGLVWMSLPGLTHVDFGYSDKVDDTVLKELALVAPGLESLTLLYSARCSDTGLRAIAASCHDLKHLKLLQAGGFSDMGFRYLSEGCHELLTLEFAYACSDRDSNFTARAMQYLSSGCKKLQKVHLKNCASVFEDGWKILLEGCRDLLDVGSDSFTDNALKVVVETQPNILCIDLTDCEWLTDTALKYLADGCKNLQKIKLHGCNRITSEGRKYLSENCSKLKQLD